MPRITHCSNPNCGKKLAEINTSGHCYRYCDLKAQENTFSDSNQRLVKNVHVSKLLRQGVTPGTIFAYVCGHLNIRMNKLLADKALAELKYARYIALYLLLDDLGLSHDMASKHMNRQYKTAYDASLHVRENYAFYRNDIEAIRKKYHPQREKAFA